MYCTKCGHSNDNEARFCASCGASLQLVMEGIAIQGDSTTAILQYASLWRRVVASIIDGILVYIASYALYFILLLIVAAIAGTTSFSESTYWGIVIIGVLVILILNPIYFILMESSSKQATLGKIALGIIVTDREGNRISFWRSALRGIVKGISAAAYGILLIVSCFTIAFTREKQALHDMVAKCHVIMKS